MCGSTHCVFPVPIATQSWFLVAEVGNFGCVGHSSAFSAKTGLIYVVGGGVASGLAAPLLFSYNPVNGTLHNLDTPNTYVMTHLTRML